MMDKVKQIFKKRAVNLTKTDPEHANDMELDHNHIEGILNIQYILQIIKLIISIMQISYLLAMGWMIMLKFVEDFFLDVDYTNEEDALIHEDAFLVYYDLAHTEIKDMIAIMMYFSFTTLSTVGFGDYCPRSDLERIMGSIILLAGVTVFSYIMGIFTDILNSYQEFTEDFNEDDFLQRFFGTLVQFNDNI
jgi:hypothetical protein